MQQYKCAHLIQFIFIHCRCYQVNTTLVAYIYIHQSIVAILNASPVHLLLLAARRILQRSVDWRVVHPAARRHFFLSEYKKVNLAVLVQLYSGE